MDFKQLQWCYFFSLLLFVLVFAVSKEIANHTTKREKTSSFFRFICFSKEPVPLVTAILIVIDYICLSVMIAFNFVSVFVSDFCALVLLLSCTGLFLVFSAIAGIISLRIKKAQENPHQAA